MSATATKLDPGKVGDSWRTPLGVLEAVRAFSHLAGYYGDIALDPCSGPGTLVGAKREICLPDDGLAVSWASASDGGGVVYVNPPYSAPGPWVRKCEQETHGRLIHALALVPVATETQWWRWGDAVCFWHGRITFLDPNGDAHYPARGGSAVVYWGYRPSKFEAAFEVHGKVVRP